MCRLVPNKIDTLVVSCGGVGTTFVVDFLKNFNQVNHSKDHDGLKHLPLQPLSFNPQFKVLYIYGDPVEAVVSLFRRGYHSTQSVKLSPWAKRSVAHQSTLADYAETGKDSLGLDRHFRHWHLNPLGYRTLMVDYHQIWDNLDIIARFMGIETDKMESFPERKPRKSSLSEIDTVVLTKLETIYADLRRTLVEIGPTFELPENRRHGLGLLTSSNALMTPYHSTVHYLKGLRKRAQ